MHTAWALIVHKRMWDQWCCSLESFASNMLFKFTIAFPTACLVWQLWITHYDRGSSVTIFSLMYHVSVCPVFILIQSSKIDRRFLSSTVDCDWTKFLDSLMYILLWWPISAGSPPALCHHCTNWSLIVCLQPFLAPAMIPFLAVSVVNNSSLITILQQ